MSALEDLGASTFKMQDLAMYNATATLVRYTCTFKMQDLATYNATATQVRYSLADAMQQEFERSEIIAADPSLEQRDLLESFRQPLGNISNASSTQQSQTQPMLLLKNYMIRGRSPWENRH
jgi:hypothetical protein